MPLASIDPTHPANDQILKFLKKIWEFGRIEKGWVKILVITLVSSQKQQLYK